MDAKSKLLKQLETYFDLELSVYDRERVLGYLKEYVATLPVAVPEIITVEKTAVKHLKTVQIISNKEQPGKSNISPYNIINLVSIASGITNRQILGKDRYAPVALARHVAMYMVKTVCDLTLTATGKLFNRDHTTVISSIKHINDMLATDPDKCIDLIEYVNNNIKRLEEKTA